MPAAVPMTVSTSLSCRSIDFVGGVLAERGEELALVDDHGDGQVFDLVAIADGRNLLGVELEVGKLLPPVLLALRGLAGERRGLLGRNVLLDRDITAVAGILRIAGLLDVAHRALDPGVRIIGGLADFVLVEVEPGRDADLEIIERRDRGSASCGHSPAIRRLTTFSSSTILCGAVSMLSPPAASTCRWCQHRHLVGHQGRDRRGDKLTDRSRPGERARPVHAHDDGGRRRLAVAPEGALVGHHDMHARRFDALHGLDGARDFAFERADAGDVLHERRQAHRPQLVEQLIAGVALLGRPRSASSIRAWADVRREP